MRRRAYVAAVSSALFMRQEMSRGLLQKYYAAGVQRGHPGALSSKIRCCFLPRVLLPCRVGAVLAARVPNALGLCGALLRLVL